MSRFVQHYHSKHTCVRILSVKQTDTNSLKLAPGNDMYKTFRMVTFFAMFYHIPDTTEGETDHTCCHWDTVTQSKLLVSALDFHQETVAFP